MSDYTDPSLADEEGVLAKTGWPMASAIGVVAAAAMVEAGYNLGWFVGHTLHLPAPLAVMFPLIMETVAGTLAIQDLRDRRRGHDSTAMRAATYATLALSSVINGLVGAASYGPAGLLEILPPLVLALVIHLHGDRATRAWHSRAVTRPEWRAARHREARVDSVLAVLPLLLGDDEHGKATVALLRRRLESCTLEPGHALVSAGWGDRVARIESPSALRRLETIADTVWGDGERPAGAQPEVQPAPTQREPAPHTSDVNSPTAPPAIGVDRRGATDDEIRAVLAEAGWPGRTIAARRLTDAGLPCDTGRLADILREHKAGPTLRAIAL
jgi:hypothetical protein